MQTQYKTALGTMLRKALDPKTGKVIPAATITDLEQSLAMKEHAADTARFRVLHLRAKLQRVQDSQREVGPWQWGLGRGTCTSAPCQCLEN